MRYSERGCLRTDPTIHDVPAAGCAVRLTSPTEDEPTQLDIADRHTVDRAVRVVVQRRRARRPLPHPNPPQQPAIRKPSGLLDPHAGHPRGGVGQSVWTTPHSSGRETGWTPGSAGAVLHQKLTWPLGPILLTQHGADGGVVLFACESENGRLDSRSGWRASYSAYSAW